MDNATAEYAFVTSFFSIESIVPPSKSTTDSLFSPTAMLSPTKDVFDDRRSVSVSEIGDQIPRPPADSMASISNAIKSNATLKAERAPLDTIWKHIIDPILEYCQVCILCWS